MINVRKLQKKYFLKLKSSYLHRSKNKLVLEKQLLYKKSFTYENLILREVQFQFLCGLPDEVCFNWLKSFNMLFEIISPYTDAVI